MTGSMVVSTRSIWDEFVQEYLVRSYSDATVYADPEQERVLHEGEVRLLGNGWVELPSGRLLSPGAVHHLDVHDDAER